MDDEQPQWLREMREREMAQFPVGQEVVVRLNGECREGVKHGTQEDGVRGMVIGIAERSDHPIHVYFRRDLPLTHSWLRTNYYTPGELEPFDTATTEAS